MNTQYLSAQLIALDVLSRNQVQKKTAGFELRRGQLPLLEILIANPDITQQELSSRLWVTPASVAQSVKRLARAGLVEKRVDPDNKRCNRLRATAAGEQAALLYRKSFDEVSEMTFAGLTDDELAQLDRLFHKMIDNFGPEAETLFLPPSCCKEEPTR